MLNAGTSDRPDRPVVAIALFDGVEALDFAGPYEVFACARNPKGEPHTSVFTFATTPQITCHGGLRVLPDVQIESCPMFDVLILPGGPGARIKSDAQEPLVKFIREQLELGKLIASICTGSYLLARTGLLDGKKATTHPHWLEHFAQEFPKVTVERQKIVEQDNLITAGGVASGIDLALHLLERWCGPEARKREALRLDGPW